VIAFNKWDMIEDRQQALADLREKTEASAATDSRHSRRADFRPDRRRTRQADAGDREYPRSVEPPHLHRQAQPLAERVVQHHPPPAVAGRRLKLKYITQAKARPPHFIVFCSRPEVLPESYTRYLVNGLRERFEMPGTPIRLSYRKGENPYAAKAKKRNIQ
jgi:GTP-binding protein